MITRWLAPLLMVASVAAQCDYDDDDCIVVVARGDSKSESQEYRSVPLPKPDPRTGRTRILNKSEKSS